MSVPFLSETITKTDAVTIVLFQVLGAFANRPLDPTLEDNEKDITVADVSYYCS